MALRRLRACLYERGCRASVRQIGAMPAGYRVPDPNEVTLLAARELNMDNPDNMERVGVLLLQAAGARRRSS